MAVRLSVPDRAEIGEVVEIKALIQHAMESGFRRGSRGEVIPRDIITSFVCTANDEEVFRWELHPGISANPFITFHLRVEAPTKLAFLWTDQHGVVTRDEADIAIA